MAFRVDLNKKNPIVIGVCGRMCSGKSSLIMKLLDHFKDNKHQIEFIECDKVCSNLYNSSKNTVEKIANCFGKDVLCDDGSINRRILGQIIFNSESCRQELNKIVWPEMYSILKSRIETSTAKLIFLEAAILFEAKWDHLCDYIIHLKASRQLIEEWMKKSRPHFLSGLNNIWSAQMLCEQLASNSDNKIIFQSDNFESEYNNLKKIISQLLTM